MTLPGTKPELEPDSVSFEIDLFVDLVEGKLTSESLAVNDDIPAWLWLHLMEHIDAYRAVGREFAIEIEYDAEYKVDRDDHDPNFRHVEITRLEPVDGKATATSAGAHFVLHEDDNLPDLLIDEYRSEIETVATERIAI